MKQPKNPYLMDKKELTIYLNKIKWWLFEFGMGDNPHPRTKEIELALNRAYHALKTYDKRLQDPDFQLICSLLL